MEMVLAWQVAVAISVVIARVFSPRAMITVAWCWTAFTFLAVWAHWLVLLQLGSVWGTVWLMTALWGEQDSASRGNTKPEITPSARKRGSIPASSSEIDVAAIKNPKQSTEVAPYGVPISSQIAEAATQLSQLAETTSVRSKVYLEHTRTQIAENSSKYCVEHIAAKKEHYAQRIADHQKKLDDNPKFAAIYAASHEELHALFKAPPTPEKGVEAPAGNSLSTPDPSPVPFSQTDHHVPLGEVSRSPRRGGIRFASTRFQVEEFTQKVRIPHLTHFTQCENLPSILRHGLMSVSACTEQGLAPIRNDIHRYDMQLEGTSLSIAFPNYRMFWKYRQLEAEKDWAVLLISTQVLWEKNCAFYRYNAADARMSRKPREQMKLASALRDMFSTTEESRRDSWLRAYDPTDPQAEVMVYETVEPDLIQAIAFETRDAQAKHLHYLAGKENFYAGKGRGFFASRRYARTN